MFGARRTCWRKMDRAGQRGGEDGAKVGTQQATKKYSVLLSSAWRVGEREKKPVWNRHLGRVGGEGGER